jgi:Tfp pilus assembly protein PilE
MRSRPSTVDRSSRRRPLAGSRRAAGERGETLVELLVTVVILGTAVVALVGALALAVRVSDIHRKQATAGAAVRAFAETLETYLARPDTYQGCADADDYTALALYDAPSGYQERVVDVDYWDGSTFAETCTLDRGIQRVSLEVASTDQRASETLDVVLRNPCREVDAACTA